ncbi:MAG: adenylyltransferase/cytidyltransferase family protein [Caldilineales bacterium]|nr:adenylyltransferase/cytidyltransferase family protein [Caldilineales bacterium]
MKRVLVGGGFDDLRSRHIRFLAEAAKLGAVHVLLWPDERVRERAGVCKFPVEERQYLLESIRYVEQVEVLGDASGPDNLSTAQDLGGLGGLGDLGGLKGLGGLGGLRGLETKPLQVVRASGIWVVEAQDDTPAQRALAAALGIDYRALSPAELAGFPTAAFDPTHLPPDRTRVLVTGCYDWFHSGHVRFFEEASQLGDLYVVAGHDANVRLLKGEGHPLFPQDERRYMVQAIRFVTQALISSGQGWMDAEPEVELVRPHIYAVNEDGDKPEKRRFCAEHGLEYVVLKRTPRPGLKPRSSSDLRGF